ncbi:PQQ-binding-like beta-propeller repeat protein [Kitasatospora acidiphila]|uniref:PQQ-binding-like beta-propeller repeat protein n=1 Tax=Kitasatospora acidiphila TaxID=2567942 RepID=A0A540W1X8_9ACTN|nr:serine/threonine-protein kinase [Kitasatospora acidiphila]TQF03030.1 PQQ-binding-like beta-propeller repeat protein [Kitasatospora acidiphila]
MKPLEPGDPLRLGPYTLQGRLGTGGMGAVYLGRSAGGRTVAVKLVRPDLAGDSGFRARFRAEVSAARAASSAFTAPVVDADPDGPVPWLATAFVPGVSLQQALDRSGPLPETTLRALTAGVAEELKNIHAARLTHRDLKPSNVLLALDGPHVIDFGIARAADGTALTTAGVVLGTPAFMSPEQALDEEVGPPADVFALGATVACAASGASPFSGGTALEIMQRVVDTEPELGSVPASLRLLVAACLAKRPQDRPTPAEIVAAVERSGGAAAYGNWLPPVLIAAVEEAAAVIGPLPLPAPDLITSSTGLTEPLAAAGGPPPAGPGATLGPTVDLRPAAGRTEPLSRRRLLLGIGGGLLLAGAAGSAAALVLRHGPTTATTPSAAPAATDPSRSLDTKVTATPIWTVPSEPPAQILTTKDKVIAVGEKQIWAYDRSGKRVWGPIANTINDAKLGTGGLSALVTGDLLFTASHLTDHALSAIALDTGKTAWTVGKPGRPVQVAWLPGALNGIVYVTGSLDAAIPTSGSGTYTPPSDFLWAVDPSTRQILWETPLGSQSWLTRRILVPSSGTRLLLTSSNTDRTAPKLTDIDTTGGGRSNWTQNAPGASTIADMSDFLVPFNDGPHCSANGLFLYASDHLYAVDPASGNLVWHTRQQTMFTSVVAAPDGKTAYAACTDGKGNTQVHAVDTSNGEIRWAGSVPVSLLAPIAALQYADGTLYLWVSGKLWALDPATGNGRWTYEFGGADQYAVSIPLGTGGGRVYAMGDNGLVALNATGKAG